MSSVKTLEINISPDDNVERCLKKFKRMCEGYGIVREYRNRKEYKKPSIKMKEKKESAEKRRIKTATKHIRFRPKL